MLTNKQRKILIITAISTLLLASRTVEYQVIGTSSI